MSIGALSSFAKADTRYVLSLLGDEGARAELGDASPPVLPTLWHSQEAQRYWKRVLQHIGKVAVAQAMAALARSALPTYRTATPGASNQRDRYVPVAEGIGLLSETLTAVESWAHCPCRTHREQVLQAERKWDTLAGGHRAAARSVVDLVHRTWSATTASQRFERDAMTGLSAASVVLPCTEVDMRVRAKLCEALYARLARG